MKDFFIRTYNTGGVIFINLNQTACISLLKIEENEYHLKFWFDHSYDSSNYALLQFESKTDAIDFLEKRGFIYSNIKN
jgi:hypothetical protein